MSGMGQNNIVEIRKFKPGDLVCLKSGGPCMVIKYPAEEPIGGQERYWCSWFTPHGEVQSAIFPVRVLVQGDLTDNISWYGMT